MKTIFLDFDGVLNHKLFFVDRYFRRKVTEEKHLERQTFSSKEKNEQVKDQIDPISVSYLNQLIKETGAKVVISSTWRKLYAVEQLRALLGKHGFTGEIIDVTPDFSGSKCESLRGNEILSWIKSNEALIGKPYYDYKDYVILDDDSDFLYWQKDNFVCVDPYCGITPRTVFQARKILGSI